jgi:hypothetical protein
MLWRSRVALAASIFAVIGAVWLVKLSPSYRECDANRKQDPAYHESANSQGERARRFVICEGAFFDANKEAITALATIAIAGFTLTLWLATTEQGRLTRESIDLGNREFAATHRPRIRVAYIKLFPLQPGHPASAELWAINIGDGHAQIIEIGADIFVRRIDTAGIAIFSATPTPYPGIPLIAPGEQVNLNIRGGTPRRVEEINGILGSPNINEPPWLQLCAVGTIHYLDANRTRRLTSFFRIYNPDRLRFMHAPDDDEYAEWEYEA